jgi:hypothetical protein
LYLQKGRRAAAGLCDPRDSRDPGVACVVVWETGIVDGVVAETHVMTRRSIRQAVLDTVTWRKEVPM